METISREGLDIVNNGVATTETVEATIIYYFVYRSSLMSHIMIMHMCTGREGILHLLKQFGPALKVPWTKLEAPELTDELAEKVIEGCEAQTGDIKMDQLEERRDDFLIELQQLLEKYWPGANLNGQL